MGGNFALLLQGTVDRREHVVEVGAQPVHRRNDRDRDSRRDQTILDCRSARFVGQELKNNTLQLRLRNFEIFQQQASFARENLSLLERKRANLADILRRIFIKFSQIAVVGAASRYRYSR